MNRWYGKQFFIVLTAFTLILIAGCNQDEKARDMANINYSKVNNTIGIDQAASVKAKKLVKDKEETTDVRAVNTDKDLYLAFNVKTFDRFQLDKVEKEVKKDLKKKFPKYNVNVSTDKKVFLELEDLEKKLKDGNVKNSKELNKKIKHIKHLKNDQ